MGSTNRAVAASEGVLNVVIDRSGFSMSEIPSPWHVPPARDSVVEIAHIGRGHDIFDGM